MESKLKTHWKENFNYDYLGAYSITGNSIVGTIKNVQKELVEGKKGKKQECTVCYFTDLPKPMILNKTNCKIIHKLYNTPFIEEWTGLKIELIKQVVDAFGEQTEALRIKPKVPTDKKPKINKERLDKAIESIISGQYSKEKLFASFDLDNNQLLLIETSLNNE